MFDMLDGSMIYMIWWIDGDSTSGIKTMAARLLSDKIIVLKQILLADIKMINTKIVTIVREMAIDQ